MRKLLRSHACRVWLMVLLMAPLFVYSQQPITGQIVSQKDQAPIPGVTVMLKGANKGTSTNVEGRFTITAKPGDILVISGVGIDQQEVTIGPDGKVLISVLQSESALNEVVVTALGVKKEKKKLGYAVQEVKGDDLVKAREPNAINGLVGKVAGLTVGSSPELLGNPNVLLRGSGINLYVVDGVPINSDTWNISPDDVETYTVLKGATASALYGSRGLNGAIMITTKRGSKDKRGFSIEFNNSTMFDKGFNAIPKVQDEYGPGDHGKYAFGDGKGGGVNDGDYDVWGPKFEGQLIPQYDSPVDPVTGERSGTPWVARGKDNLERYIETGLLMTNNISVSSKSDKSDLRFSVSNTYQDGIVPNTKLTITNFNISAGYNFTEKLRLESYINYNRQSTPNIPDVQYGPNSMIYNITLWAGADWSMDDMRNYWQPGKEGVQSIYAEYQRYHNPYFMAYEWLRSHNKNDVNGNLKLSYKLNKNFDFLVRTQVTTYDLLRTEKMPYSAHPYGREEGKGDYREDRRSMFETNTDALVTYQNNHVYKDISVRASVGGNIRNFKYNSSFTTTDYLNVPGLYAFSNSRNPIRASSYAANMLVLSGYGYLDIGFSKYANLSLTGRYDKLSTLPDGNNLYFYPSASLSTVVTDYLQLPEFISFLKFRGSYANVKGGLTMPTIGATPQASYPLSYGAEYYSSYDGPTYENSASYTTPLVYDNKAGAYFTNTINNPAIQPFSSEVIEAGMDIRFIKNRIGFDLTYFVNDDGPRIYQLPISTATGFSAALVNGITTRKTGWEATLSGTPVRSKSGFSWDVLINWSTFKENLTSIYPGVEALNVFLKVGDRIDKIYGSAFVRTPEGQLINDAGGRPLRAPRAQFLGTANPDWVWAINNTFRYKNFNLGFQFDGRVGGSMINYVQQQTFRGGRHVATIEGKMGEARYQDYLGNKSWVGDGVVVSNGVPIEYDADGKVTNYKELEYADNTSKTYLQDYISFYYATNEANIIKKTFAKLREVVIGYSFPPSMLSKTFIRQASISFVGRNLFYFSEYKDVDIDQYAGANSSSGLQTPTTKRYGFNINLTF
ncbi:SusC/RagA family TonB-linked outer membrane protein [Flavihumibacter fluvii]|uniref:SusC/RagA family TonB-linked outer membrane protein n=1 Tax=Flavihumibacter fluvii TaxID=2838157 RepID=UPI001BDF4845|nr:SusC/RagA family TonB-linked outer membrane protein [Flavihumibacter fluvii]ULQ52027.1 SusC/RagA family TonB-linked outer membrane protein [Flavihumibacter fluvii]